MRKPRKSGLRRACLTIGWLFLLAACEVHAPTSPIVLGKTRIHFDSSSTEDALALARFHGSAVGKLRDHFSRVEQSRCVGGFICDIWLHSKPNEKANESRAVCETQVQGAFYRADIHLLTPCAYTKSARSHIGEAKGRMYVERLLVHEYSAPLLDTITRGKKSGWRFFSAPRWFVQGYEEYLALHCSNTHSLRVTKARYLEIVRHNPERIRLGEGIEVTSPYLDGPVLVEFMDQHFGRTKLHAVLASREPSFERAVSTQMAEFPGKFFRAFQSWIAAPR